MVSQDGKTETSLKLVWNQAQGRPIEKFVFFAYKAKLIVSYDFVVKAYWRDILIIILGNGFDIKTSLELRK